MRRLVPDALGMLPVITAPAPCCVLCGSVLAPGRRIPWCGHCLAAMLARPLEHAPGQGRLPARSAD
jgi:hypothetical protein